MKRMRKIRSLLAMVTALALILSGGMVSAEDAEEVKNQHYIFYDELNHDLKVIADDNWPHGEVTESNVWVNGQLDGNLTVESSKAGVDVFVDVYEGITGDVTIAPIFESVSKS